ncbi:hypothetical protein CR513_48700, partial [Mucuna pruriens]
MEMYVKSNQYNMWKIITKEDVIVNKPKVEFHYPSTKCKSKKVATLMRHYKIFVMKESETIDEIHEFFKDQNKLKILDSLSKSITIQDACNMKTLTLDKLLKALRVHEVHLQKREKLNAKDPITLTIGETSTKR